MKQIKIKGGILNVTETNFNEVVQSILADNGLPVLSSCCFTGNRPTNGQTLSWNSTANKLEFVSGGAGGATNLGYTPSPNNGVITNSNGTISTIPLVNSTNAGLSTPAMFNALAGTTPTNAQLGVGNTYIGVTDPSSGTINFVVDGNVVGNVQIVAGNPKWTFLGMVDPEVYLSTPINTTRRNTWGNNKGALIYNTDIDQYEYNNGTTWSALGGGGLTLTSPLTGLSLASSTDITATDTIIGAFGKLQAQLDLTPTAALTNSNIFVGNSSNVAVGVPMSGQATISNTGAITIDNAAVISKVLTGFTSGSGTITATDSILTSIQKLDSNSKIEATETVKGVVELATQLETSTGTSTTLVPTVKTVADTYIKKQFLSNGDLLVGGIAGAETVLAKGANGQILSVDTSVAIQQLKWVNNTPSRFVKTFVSGDWTIVGAEASLAIPFTEHSTSLTPIIRIEENITGVFHKVGVSEEVDAAGNIVLKTVSTSIFNGRTIIM